jgi:hypothetical protein
MLLMRRPITDRRWKYCDVVVEGKENLDPGVDAWLNEGRPLTSGRLLKRRLVRSWREIEEESFQGRSNFKGSEEEMERSKEVFLCAQLLIVLVQVMVVRHEVHEVHEWLSSDDERVTKPHTNMDTAKGLKMRLLRG